MTPEGYDNVQAFFAGHPLTQRGEDGVNILQSRQAFASDRPFFDLMLANGVHPSDVLTALAEVENRVGAVGAIALRSKESNRGAPSSAQATLRYVSTWSTYGGTVCMTFEDTDAAQRKGASNPR